MRFYSDEGLLPLTGRTESGYRVYSNEDLVHLDLIHCATPASVSRSFARCSRANRRCAMR
ncbi:MerR family transcriptional regulator [Bradyrhizobium prioriisuperbiae]|uniref:MerR family transcriptional regulator n=1 Tax=Bradyrhizobium prioriisuperbiae TaxID=2854389 RepID=UPI0028EDC4BC|nr:MerR family transcriptional regulator [Bradyrhizobium prioritasuperba]